jgi:hypothetical protein
MAFLYMLAIVLALSIIVATCDMAGMFPNCKWFCNKMGWHQRPKRIGFDGCSANGICPRCGKHVLQDSQGNWS